MRPDLFIVWGNGVQYLNEIMVILRDHFRIVFIKHHTITDLPKFVDDIYACDSYPLEHLKAKTRYLLQTAPECYIILVENHNVNEQMVGADPYRKPQCLYLQSVKNKIRDKFNTRKNGRRTENHVIHGTDYVTQVDHILKVFGLPNKETYLRKTDFPVYYPWHLPPPKHYSLVPVSAMSLRANILGKGLVRITETPHYKYLIGRKEEYIEYHQQHVGRALMEDHFPEAFDELIKVRKYDPIIINGTTILDGVHRLAIAFFRNEPIKAYNVDI